MKNKIQLLALLPVLFLIGCGNNPDKAAINTLNSTTDKSKQEMKVTKKLFGKLENNQEVYSFLLQSENGVEAEIIEYGAIVKNLKVPDKDGNIADIVLGYDNIEGYLNDGYYLGATIGRVTNRIGGAQFSLNGKKYELAPNTLPDFGRNHIHGGVKGFNKVLWSGEEFKNDSVVGVRLTYMSKDGEEGYPGNLNCVVEYTINEDQELHISYKATTDQTTLVNFTHHGYFNLSGAGEGDILNNTVQINADNYTPTTEDLVPTGEIANVAGLPVDFTEAKSVGSRIDKMKFDKFDGYDLNYVLNHAEKGSLDLAATVTDPVSGRIMEVLTTQPCMQFYTANFLSGEPGKGDKPYIRYGALCFEPQGFPDAPNHDLFQSIVLEPGETYQQEIVYRFPVIK